MNKKKSKKGANNRAGTTWVRRGTQGHVAEPCRPTQRLRGACTYLFIHTIYNKRYSASRISGRVFESSYPPGFINPTGLFNLFCVGLKSERSIAIGARRSSGRAVHGSRSRPRAF